MHEQILEVSAESASMMKGFNTYEDPIREVMGAAFESHPKESQVLIDSLDKIGVEVVYSDSPGMVYQPGFGKAGRIRLDRESSYSALLHEYTHAMDDFISGWQGSRYLYDDEKLLEFETRAYDAEIAFSRLNNVEEEYIIRLEKLKEAEIKRIKGRWD